MNGYGAITGNISAKNLKNPLEFNKIDIKQDSAFFLHSIQDAYSILNENIELIDRVNDIKEQLDPTTLETAISRIYYSLQSAHSCMFNAGNKDVECMEKNSDDAYLYTRNNTDEYLVRGCIIDHKICVILYYLAQTVTQTESFTNLSVLKPEPKNKYKKMYKFIIILEH
ncbi:hypothetical protein HZS_4278 [Henneguya salminicola]|nr:hypothetical protein HZS_4278 [Henneguya salminicola]